jgi:hypothetical protein
MIIQTTRGRSAGFSGCSCDINHIVDTSACFRYLVFVRCRYFLRPPKEIHFHDTLTEGVLCIGRALGANLNAAFGILFP